LHWLRWFGFNPERVRKVVEKKQDSEVEMDKSEEVTMNLRALTMEDLKEAKKRVSSWFSIFLAWYGRK
jgi:hypothetical protein